MCRSRLLGPARPVLDQVKNLLVRPLDLTIQVSLMSTLTTNLRNYHVLLPSFRRSTPLGSGARQASKCRAAVCPARRSIVSVTPWSGSPALRRSLEPRTWPWAPTNGTTRQVASSRPQGVTTRARQTFASSSPVLLSTFGYWRCRLWLLTWLWFRWTKHAGAKPRPL